MGYFLTLNIDSKGRTIRNPEMRPANSCSMDRRAYITNVEILNMTKMIPNMAA